MSFAQKKSSKHVMVTCYDATFARILSDTEAFDSLLIGDSLGNVIQGESSTVSVTMDQMIYHTKAVARGAARATRPPLLIADMPAGSYLSPSLAVENAQALIEVGAQMVKLEGNVSPVVKALVEKDIRVCGHIGLTPQTIHDYKVQGRTQAEAERLMEEAKVLEAAGVELLVLELIPWELAKEITEAVKIQTIGIGAGSHCDGQVLVLYDLLGLNPDFSPKFLKKFADGYQWVKEAASRYSHEVKTGSFPQKENAFSMNLKPTAPTSGLYSQ